MRKQAEHSSVLATVVNCRPEFGCWSSSQTGESVSSMVLFILYPRPRCFWPDCVQWPPSGNWPLLLHATLHLWPSDALPRSLHLHANTCQFRDRNWYVCHVHSHEIPHLPPTSLPWLVTGTGQPIPDHLTFLPPLLRNLCWVLPVLHDLRGRPVPPTHPPTLHQCLHGINAPQPQPSQPEWCGWGRREPQ